MKAGSTLLLLAAFAAAVSLAQRPPPSSAPQATVSDQHNSSSQPGPLPNPGVGVTDGLLRQQAAQRFLAQRGISGESRAGTTDHPPRAIVPTARSMQRARTQQQSLLRNFGLTPDVATPGTWQSLGPAQVSTAAYGPVTGRITSLAADPNSGGNTLYLGATGGGVWKSINAAGSPGSTFFTPLTDNLAAFTAQSGPFGGTLSSISIGALSIQPGSSDVILAGTGDINDALDSYYGVGILRSADGGLTWTLIGGSKDALNGGLQNYSFTGNGFAGFAWSTVNTSLVVAAVAQSAEGVIVNAGSTEDTEAGLYYSSDGGQTWYLTVVEDDATDIVQSPKKAYSPPGNSATSVLWNPVRKRFYAAIRFHGYYESTDGITWTRLANQPGASLAASACPTNPGGTGQTSCPIFRGALAVQPVTGDLFALTTDLNNLDQGLFRDVCSTTGLAVSACASSTVAFGTQIASGALENGSTDPSMAPTTILLADYDLTLAAVPSQQDTILFAGTEDIYRCSLANSCAWRNTTNIQTCAAAMVAPSQHAIESSFGSTGLLYFANDGGLWRSTDTVAQTGSVCASSDASHYQNLNGGIGSLAEITHFSISPTSSTTLLAGMGGFGTVATANGEGAWQQLLTGEGSFTAIDPSTLANVYAEAGSGVNIHRCTEGSACNAAGFGAEPVIGSAQVEGDADAFTEPAPWLLDPLDSANILLGTCRVWRGPATGGWAPADLLSPMLDGNQQPFCNDNAQLRSIGAGLDASAPSGSEQIYAGIAGPYDGGSTVPGHVFGSTVPASGGLTTWTDLWNSPVTNSTNAPQFNPGGFSVSSIAVDPHDATGQTVYVTMQGFAGYGVSEGEVYGSTNGGATWLNLTNDLPLAPANGLVIDPNVPSILYIALDTGVYYTQNVAACSDPDQSCWAVYGSGLPNAPVTSLEIFSAGASSILEASTYGRGIWALALLTAPAQGTLTPASYTFASQQVETSSSTAAAFRLTNTGSTPMVIAAIQVSSDYSETNNCGSSLAASASCIVEVTFTPVAAGDRPGTLTVFANVSGSHLSSTLDGTGLAPGTTTPAPTSVNFPSTAVGFTSPVQTVSIQNTGGIAVTLQPLTVTNDYQLSANTCGSSLAPGASCSTGISFSPSATGDRPGRLSIPSSVPGSPTLVPLDGTGVLPPALTLSPTSLSFANTASGSVSASQSITVTSSGGAPAQLQTPNIAGNYQITGNSCGSTLAAAATCVIQVAFAPATTGSRPGLLTIPANVSGGQVTAALSGTGVNPAALSLSPASLTFASTTEGVTSAAKSVTLTSTGGVNVQLQTPTVTGDYTISSNTCGATLSPGATCTLQVTFTPTATGDRPGLLTVPANITNSPATASLDGTGISPPSLTLTPVSLTFAQTAVGSATAAQSILVTNLGGTVAQLLTPTTTGDFAVSGNSCGSSLGINGAHCTLQVTFTPTAAGARTGVLTLSGPNLPLLSSTASARSRSMNSPAVAIGQVTAALSGTGAAPPVVTFSPSPANYGAVAEGAASTPPLSITVTNQGSIPVQLQMPTITGNFVISDTTCTSALAANASCAIDVYFHPETVGALYGSLILAGSMQGSQITDSLSGIGTIPGPLTILPTSLSYNDLLVGSSSSPKTVTATNTSSNPVTLSPAIIATGNSSDFTIASDTCGTTLAPNAQCIIGVTFHPGVASARRSQLQQSDTAGDQPLVSLGGNGISPLTISPAAQDFGSVVDGATGSPNPFTVTNPGGTSVSLSSAAITADAGANYVIRSTTCGASLGPSPATCTINVTFQPQSVGTLTGTLTQPSEGNTPTSSLTGSGLPPGSISMTPLSFSYPATVVGSTSAANQFTVTNPGDSSVSVSPNVPTGYQLVHSTCPGTLAAGGQCALSIAFAPTAPGDQPGTLTFTGSTTTASLDGTGLAPARLTFSPATPNFGSVLTGASSPAQVITLTNTGGVPLQLGAPSVTSEYSLTQAGTCQTNTSLVPAPAAGSSCTLQIIFSPTSSGDQQGLLTVPGSMPGGSSTAPLDGIGVLPGALSLSPPSLTSFGRIILGATSGPQTLMVSNSGGSSLTGLTADASAGYLIASNGCTGPLAAGASCTLGVTFAPTALGDQPGTITVSAAGAMSRYADLDGIGVAPAKLVFAPTSLSFGSVEDGKSSAPQAATLSNSGGAIAQLNLPVVTGEYTIASTSCAATLAPAVSCALQITFSPTTAGSHPGIVTVTTSDASTSATVSLTGTGTLPPALVLTPTALTFAATGQGITTAAQNITVANIGSTAVNLQPFTISGDFAISADNCSGTPLKPTYSCPLSITFTPIAGGQRTGLLTVSSPTETHTATLTGIGLSPATDTLSTGSLTFGPQVFGTVSPAKSVSITNSGGSTLNSIATMITGPFLATNNCGTLLGGGLTCSVAVSFAPIGAGAETGLLTITDAERSQTVQLGGQGVLPPQAVATPASLTFGSYAVGATTPAQLVTMTNNGKTSITGLTAVTGSSLFAVATNSCGSTIAAGASCTLGITFTPPQPGNATDQLTLSSPSLDGPLTVALSGTGEDFQLSTTGSASDLITDGQTATYHVVVTPVGSSAGALTVTCTGAPANSSCIVNPPGLTVSGGATGSITVTIATGLTSTGAFHPAGPGLLWRSALALLLPCLLLRAGKSRVVLVLLVSLSLVFAPTACGVHASGGSSSKSTSSSGTTPPGEYPITISANFPGAQRTVTLTLTVE